MIRTIVRGVFWFAVVIIIWTGASSIETQPAGWQLQFALALVLLVVLTIITWRRDSNRGGHGTR